MAQGLGPIDFIRAWLGSVGNEPMDLYNKDNEGYRGAPVEGMLGLIHYIMSQPELQGEDIIKQIIKKGRANIDFEKWWPRPTRIADSER